MKRPLIATVIMASVVAIAGVAFATIPDGQGVIHGCYRRSGGQLRVINSDKGQTCAARERSLNWSKQGPRGARGARGPQGPTGPQGSQGDPGVTSVTGEYLSASS